MRLDHGSQPDDVLIVVAPPEIDLITAPELAQAVERAHAEARRLVFDLTATTYMDSCGLAVLAAAYRDLGRRPEAVVVRSPCDLVRRLLDITGLDACVTIEDETSGGAVAAV